MRDKLSACLIDKETKFIKKVEADKEGVFKFWNIPNGEYRICTIEGKITDFSGNSDNLAYTDYKQAFTDGSTLIDTSTVDLGQRANSIGGVKSQRSNLSYTMTSEDEQRLALQRLQEQQEEQKRVSRLNVYDQRQGEAYEKIHSMLLR